MKKRVLFVCIHNSARSQMAEAFVNTLAGEYFEAESAGIEPGQLNSLVVEVMRESGIDISKNSTDSVAEFIRQGRCYDYVITVCDEGNSQRCPVFSGVDGKAVRLHWGFEDPSSLSGDITDKRTQTRRIRDQIKAKIHQWIKEQEL